MSSCFRAFLDSAPLVLLEAAVAERLSRLPGLALHQELYHTPLIYPSESAAALAGVYHEYLDIAREAGLPMLLSAPTWRLDAGRVEAAGVPYTINTDAVRFVREVVAEAEIEVGAVRVAGLLGPAHDCYTPEAALGVAAARAFHASQAKELAAAGVDVLLGQTLPALSEAQGMAAACIRTGVPTLISWCIRPDGRVLDGTPLDEAMRQVDEATDGEVVGYLVNCAYPTYLQPEQLDPALRARLLGFDANGSSRVPWSLEEAVTTRSEPVQQWAADQLHLHRALGLRVLGGCCGTTGEHLRALVQGIAGS